MVYVLKMNCTHDVVTMLLIRNLYVAIKVMYDNDF